MTQRGNGGIIGVQNNPTLSTASGVWAVNEIQRATVGATWPLSILPDPNFRNVTLLLNGEGTNGATNNTFIDSSTNNLTITRNGNTTQGTFSPYGDRWSNFFDGSGDLLTFPSSSAFDFSATPNTFEFWLYPLALPSAGNACRVFMAGSNSSQNAFVIEFAPNGTISVGVPFGGNTSLATPSGTLQLQQWQHFVIVQNGANSAIYKNGIQVATGTITGPSSGAVPFKIGFDNVGTVDFQYSGYISNFRIVKGTAVYTANFTPPTAPLTAISGTSLLTCQSNRLRDASTNNFTITRNGDVSVQRFSPFSPTAPYAAATTGGSGYFDGSGDYLALPANSAFQLGTGDFTIEFWSNLSATGIDDGVFWEARSTGATSTGFVLNSRQATGGYRINFYTGGGANVTTSSVAYNTWNHIAVTRSSGTLRIFLNGVVDLTATFNNNFTDNPSVTVGQSLLYANSNITGYLSNFRVVKGAAVYTANFTPPTAPVTAITNTSLLLNFTNGGIIDTSMLNNLETVGNAQISTSIRKYGIGSISIPGGGANLYIPPSPIFDMGAGDFTIECWVNSTSIAANYPSFISSLTGWSAGSSGHRFNNLGAANKFTFHLNGAGDPFLTSTNTYSFGVWYHYALTRSGNTWRMFIDGVQQASGTFTGSFNAALGGFRLGYAQWDGTNGYYNGYIDDVRVTRGVARYTANFTPPTLQLPGL